MAKSGADANSLADRKEAERRRLAEALRANLGRRKARSRHRLAAGTAADAVEQDLAGGAGATGDAARTGASSEDAAQDVETGD